MAGLLRHLHAMLFGHHHSRPGAPLLVTHAETLRAGREKRHAVKTEQQELQARLDYLALEAETFAGFHGSDEKPSPPADLHR
jgi:hypothetical protein